MSYQTSQNIQVAVRCRPLNDREIKLNSIQVIDCHEKRKEILAIDKSAPVPSTKTFTFDKVFGVHSTQSEVYNQVVRPAVMEVMEGYNCTIFAYGQTGTGKTFTMEGNSSSLLNEDTSNGLALENDASTGIIPRSVAHLFTYLNSISNCEYSVKISFIELYNEELSDLLSEATDKLRIYDDPARKGSVIIPGLEEVVVQNKTEVYRILQKGAEKRQKASTLMNSQSSRSHSIFTITVFLKEKSLEGEEILKVGKLNLVDLAGSENIERSGATGKRAAEAGKINKSLTTLGRVITALVEHREHIPYRESNLTRLLQDSLGGRTKTTIIATISPALCNIEETLSTLDYAHKAKSIRNKPEVNQKLVKKALIKEYTEEIDKLKRELWATREKNGIYLPGDLHESMVSKLDTQKEEIRDLLQKITVLNDEIEKLNDLFKDTKQNLDEKCLILSTTQKKLTVTETNLQQVKQECEESKFIIEEKAKTETVLLQQAQDLHNVNKVADGDCQNLHHKIKRINQVSVKNKSLTQMFSKQMNENLLTILKQETEMSNDHKENFCTLCEQLTEVNTKVNDMKSEILCELHVFDEQQQSWLENLSKLLQTELETNCSKFYELFINSLNSNNEFIKSCCDEQLSLCTHHEKLFMTTYLEIQNIVNKMEKNSNDFTEVFVEKSNQYLTNNKQEIQACSSDCVNNLDKLFNSMENVQKDVNSLKSVQQELQLDIFETIESFQATFLQITTRFRQKFQTLEEKFQDITNKNNSNLTELSHIKELIRVKETDSILNRNNEFQELVSQPVKQLIESNEACLKEIQTSSKSLHENYQLCNQKLNQSINTIVEKQKENSDNLNGMVSNRLEKLDSCNNEIQSNIQKQKDYAADFFIQINRDQIGRECEEISNITKKSLQLTELTQMSMENLSERSKEFYNSTINSVNKFSDKDFTEDVPTGLSPPPKTYFNTIDFARSKRNSLLVEEFRAKQDLLQVPDSRGSSRPNSPDITGGLVEMRDIVVPVTVPTPAVPSKRTADKENNDRGNADKHSKNVSKNPKIRKLNNNPSDNLICNTNKS